MAVSCGGLIILIALVILISILMPWTFLPCPFALEHPCGVIFNESSGKGCANPIFEVICENNKSVMSFNYGQRHARAIIASSSSSSSFRYIMTGVSPHNNCPIINSLSLPYENVSFFTDPFVSEYIVVMRCEKPVDYGNYWDVSSKRCGGGGGGGGGNDGEEEQYYSYVVVNYFYYRDFVVKYIAESCRVEMKVMISRWDEKVKCNSSKCGYPEVHSEYL
ncbi:kinase R-like protein, partial [Trifolium medium]|nr:kinase R-like protein [Trifolium medium]